MSLIYNTTYKMLRRTGEKICNCKLRVEMSQIGGDKSAMEEFMIDTGAMYTTIPMDMAIDIGLTPNWVKEHCETVPLTAANGERINGYLHKIHLRIDDDYGGHAEWDAFVVFAEEVNRPHAGRSGFLHNMRFADKGNTFELDPVGVPSNQFNCASRQTVH